MKELNDQKNVCLLHIDEHYDSRNMDENSYGVYCKNVDLNIDEYLNLRMVSNKGKNTDVSLIVWDNFIGFFVHCLQERLKKLYFLTHGIGDKLNNFDNVAEDLNIVNINRIADLGDEKSKFIIDIDLDFFFYLDDTGSDKERKLLFSEDYIQKIINKINKLKGSNRLLCITIALSPECCGNWDNSLRLFEMFNKNFNLEFPITDWQEGVKL